MKIVLENVSVLLGEWEMENISCSFESGSFVSIVGPSGSGKTTLLRVIAGLQPTNSGKIFFEGEDVSFVPPEKRNAGLVFQNDALFPHLSVFENVAFGVRMKKLADVKELVSGALKTVHLEGFDNRQISSLSGGEKKRVAIARAIAFKPGVLLLDEPLNGLDAPLKEKMKLFLKELQKKTGLTIVLVTHDIDEAFFLSDRIIVLNNGKVEQSDVPENIFEKPKTVFVKNFVSDYIVVRAKSKKISGKDFVEGTFRIPSKKKGSNALVSFRKTNYRIDE